MIRSLLLPLHYLQLTGIKMSPSNRLASEPAAQNKKFYSVLSSAAPNMEHFSQDYRLQSVQHGKNISPKFKMGFSSSPCSYISATQAHLAQCFHSAKKSFKYHFWTYRVLQGELESATRNKRVSVQSSALSLPIDDKCILTACDVVRTTKPNNNSSLSITSVTEQMLLLGFKHNPTFVTGRALHQL